jgi:hypothetical protein
MAIERVGGAKAYVIKGTSNPSARANYWANLVTQEKYKIWEAAQQEALSQMKREELQFASDLELFQSQKDSLEKYKRQVQTDIDDLKMQKLKGTPKSSTTTRPASTRGAGGTTANAFDRELKDIRDTADKIAELKAEIALKENAGIDVSNQKKAVANNTSYLKNKMDKIDASGYSNRDKVIAKNLIKQTDEDYTLNMNLGPQEPIPPAEQAAAPAAGGTQTTTTTKAGLSKQAIADIEKRIAELTTELQTTQASIDELVPPTLAGTSLLDKTRQVLREDLQPVERIPRSRPLSQRRIEELEALGMEPNFIQEQLSVLRGDKEAPEEPLFSQLYTEPELSPTEQMNLAERQARLNQFLAEKEIKDSTPAAPITANKLLELEALGIDPSEPPEFAETPLVGRREARKLARETYKPQPEPTFEFAPSEAEVVTPKPVETKVVKQPTNAELEYKREVIYASNNEDALKALTKEDKQDWVNVVQSLYTPTQNQTPQERAELLQNAWNEITLAYSEDRETMKKAHTLLLAIDKDYNNKQKPK